MTSAQSWGCIKIQLPDEMDGHPISYPALPDYLTLMSVLSTLPYSTVSQFMCTHVCTKCTKWQYLSGSYISLFIYELPMSFTHQKWQAKSHPKEVNFMECEIDTHTHMHAYMHTQTHYFISVKCSSNLCVSVSAHTLLSHQTHWLALSYLFQPGQW